MFGSAPISPINPQILLMLFHRHLITFSTRSLARAKTAGQKGYTPHGLNLRSREAFPTTDTELNAIAPAAIIGFSSS